jgi:hypothetical protein
MADKTATAEMTDEKADEKAVTDEKADEKAEDTPAGQPPLAEGIKHVYGTLYEVPHGGIYVAKKGEAGSNLRYLSGDDENLGVGFSKSDMDRLYGSIKNSGMHNPLICRWVVRDGFLTVQLVDGERRWRTIDRLLSKREKCYDPASKKMVGAKELYSNLLVRVYDAASDKEAMLLSYQENRSRVAFNDRVDIALVGDMRAKGFTDKEILEVTAQKADWLRDTDKLIEALKDDAETMFALSEGAIKRDAALVFVGIADREARSKAIREATEYADRAFKKKIEKIEKSIQRAKVQREEAAADEVEAKIDKDAEAEEEAKSRKQQASQTIEEKTREKQEAKPEVGGRTARKATRNVGAARPNDGSNPRAMSHKKITTEFLTPYEALIKAQGKPEGSEEAVAHPDVLKCMRDVAKAIATGDEGQAMRLAKKWGKHFEENGFDPEDN